MAHEVDSLVGRRIRQRRWYTGISQQELANRVGVKFQQIQKYETGANRVSASRLWQIAQGLDVDISYFFSEGPFDSDAANTEPSKEFVLLLQIFHQLPTEQRDALLRLAKAMAV